MEGWTSGFGEILMLKLSDRSSDWERMVQAAWSDCVRTLAFTTARRIGIPSAAAVLRPRRLCRRGSSKHRLELALARRSEGKRCSGTSSKNWRGAGLMELSLHALARPTTERGTCDFDA